MKKISLEEATMKALEGKSLKKESGSIDYEDYIAVKYDDDYDSMIVFFFDHSLTNGEVDKIKETIDSIGNGESDYEWEDLEEAINEVVPFIKSMNIDNSSIIYI